MGPIEFPHEEATPNGRCPQAMVVGVAVLAAVGGFVAVGNAAAQADPAPPTGIVVSGGETQPVLGYTDAVRQRVWVESDSTAAATA